MQRYACGRLAGMFVLTCAASVAGQETDSRTTRAQLVMRACNASERVDGPEVDEVRRIDSRLGVTLKTAGLLTGHRIHVAVLNSEEFNAHHAPLSVTESMLCIPAAMAHYMGNE